MNIKKCVYTFVVVLILSFFPIHSIGFSPVLDSVSTYGSITNNSQTSNFSYSWDPILNLDSNLTLDTDGPRSFYADGSEFMLFKETRSTAGIFSNLTQSEAKMAFEFYDSNTGTYHRENLDWQAQNRNPSWQNGKLLKLGNEVAILALMQCDNSPLGQYHNNQTICSFEGFESQGAILLLQVLNSTTPSIVTEEYVLYHDNCGRIYQGQNDAIQIEDFDLAMIGEDLHITVVQKLNSKNQYHTSGAIVSDCKLMLNNSAVAVAPDCSSCAKRSIDHIKINRTNGLISSENVIESHISSTQTKIQMGKTTLFFDSGTAGSNIGVGCYNLSSGQTTYSINQATLLRKSYGLSVDFALTNIGLINSTCAVAHDVSNISTNSLNYRFLSANETNSKMIVSHTDNFVGEIFNVPATRHQVLMFDFSSNGSIVSFQKGPINEEFYKSMEKQISGDASLTVHSNTNQWVSLRPDLDLDSVPDYRDSYPAEHSQQYDTDGDGYGDNQLGFNGDNCPSVYGESTHDVFGCLDSDGDGWSETRDFFPYEASQWNDTDNDGFGDNESGFRGDACPESFGESDKDRFGCEDNDGDGWSDENDMFPYDSSQWSDWDGDGFGDQFNGFEGDACPADLGNSTKDRFGCVDSDDDGWSDTGDDFPFNPTQWVDRDGDGYGDNQSQLALMVDMFPTDVTQWTDIDGDGHGDNPYGTEGDWFPDDPSRWQDSDRDGVADEDDAFPNERSQSEDMDGDGYGDNPDGENPDAFPSDPDEWQDTDGDDVGNNEDAFPFDPSQTTDADGDGFGDNPRGTGADKFPEDSTQWSDIDGDGHGDNAEGTTPDAFIADPTQWSDVDGDGYGDNPTGRQADAFPNDPTQWEDFDGDGLGDNQSGNNPDPFLFDLDNDGYNDSIDPLPKLASPGDLDNDGVLDGNDLFPEDYREWADADGDGEGDNADTDDDNDGWPDADEIRQGFDPFSSSSQPVDSFEIVIPGTAIGLGAWDLIGMFGGIPLAFWILFGFATRNQRTSKYETMLRGATSRDELEDVARQWEYSLMLRLLGPHQGIRLERLRAELDDRFEAQNQPLSSIESEYIDHTYLVEDELVDESKQPPTIFEDELNSHDEALPHKDTPAQETDENGYEWFTDENGVVYYRPSRSSVPWVKFEN